MSMLSNSHSAQRRQIVLIAPTSLVDRPNFGRPQLDPAAHEDLLQGLQRLRGSVYLADGAIEAKDLTEDGRHVQAADEQSWHVVVADGSRKVYGCIRSTLFPCNAKFQQLGISHSALAHSDQWGVHLREAVEAELAMARQRGMDFGEVGGWALAEELRSTSEAIRLALSIFGFGRLLGGGVGISTATTRHHSSSILRRIGGRSLSGGGSDLPPYFDPQYQCEMEVLRFDASRPNPRYETWAEECREMLAAAPVIMAGESRSSWLTSARNLERALNPKTHVLERAG